MAQQRNVGIVLSLRDQFSAPLRRNLRSVNTLRSSCRQLGRDARRGANQMADSFTSSAKAVAKSLSVAGLAGLTYFAKKSIDLASDLKEVQNVVDVTFGDSTKEINSFAKGALKDFGLTQLEAKKFTGTMGAMLKSSGLTGKSVTDMSKSLTGLTGDFASFYNLKSEEAFTKIRAGISGETEPLKQLGINMSVANLETYRMSKGIKKQYKNMTQAEKIMLRYNYLLSVSKDAQGDYARTSTSWANQTKTLTANIGELGASIGNAVMPYLEDWINKVNDYFPIMQEKVNDFIEGIPKIAEEITKVIDKAKDLYNFIKSNRSDISGVISTIVGAIVTYNAVMKIQALYTGISTAAIGIHAAVLNSGAASVNLFTIAQWGFNAALTANPIGFVITLIASFIAIGVLMYNHWDTISAGLNTLWEGTKVVFGTIWGGIKSLWSGFASGFMKVFNVLKTGYLNGWIAMYNGFINIINLMITGINKLIETINLIPSIDIGEIPELEKAQYVKLKAETEDNTKSTVPRNAMGTNYWRGGVTGINEVGNEMINLPSGSQIIPASQVENNIDKTNDINIHINIENVNNVKDVDSFMTQVVNRLNLALENQF